MHSEKQRRKLGELIDIKHGFAFGSEFFAGSGPYVLLTPGNFVEEGGFRWMGEKQKYFTGKVDRDYLLNKGDLLIAMTEQAPGLLGSSFFVPEDDRFLHNQRLGKVVVHRRDSLDADFLHHWLNLSRVRQEVFANATGTKVKHTSPDKLRGLDIILPPLREQRRIAQILHTWDEAIEKKEALRAAKERRRKGILQCLFGNGVDFPSDWGAKPLSAVTTRVSRTNDGGDHPVMTISAKSGFLMQSEKFARDMAGSSVDKYTLLHQGEFAYNKGNSKTAPYGCIFALDRPTAVIPFVYFCFRLNDGHDHGFFEHMFDAGILNHQLSRIINSGVRNDGLLNLYADDFFACLVPVPPQEVQQRIARAITALNDDIALTYNEITALQRQKRGLMQKLLTGEWCVQIDETVGAAEP